jgi:hypothetical protein
MLENSVPAPRTSASNRPPVIEQDAVGDILVAYLSATTGLVDFFDERMLGSALHDWAEHIELFDDITSAVHFLIFAIGQQTNKPENAAQLFQHAKGLALASLGGNLSIGIAQAFALITVYMLRACQINGAFLFLGIAARAAYSIGIHRMEVNTRFEPAVCTQRKTTTLEKPARP